MELDLGRGVGWSCVEEWVKLVETGLLVGAKDLARLDVGSGDDSSKENQNHNNMALKRLNRQLIMPITL